MKLYFLKQFSELSLCQTYMLTAVLMEAISRLQMLRIMSCFGVHAFVYSLPCLGNTVSAATVI